MRWRRFLYLLILSISCIAHGEDGRRCALTLKSLYESIKVDFTSSADRRIIADAFSTGPDDKAAKTAFEIYLENRTKKLPFEFRKRAFDVVEKRGYSSHSTNSVYDAHKQYIQIGLQPKWRGTIIDYHVTAHELEHFIHDITVLEEVHTFLGYHLHRRDTRIPLTFLDELGAMTAEWQYINTIPNEARYRLIDSIENEKEDKPYRDDYMIRILKSGSMKRPAYIRSEWAYDRYSLDGFRSGRY